MCVLSVLPARASLREPHDKMINKLFSPQLKGNQGLQRLLSVLLDCKGWRDSEGGLASRGGLLRQAGWIAVPACVRQANNTGAHHGGSARQTAGITAYPAKAALRL